MEAKHESTDVTLPESRSLQQSESAAIISVIERVAMSPDADIEKLEKMLDMQERVLNRNARMEFDAALAMMQAEMPEVERLADGHNSKYAKFDKILAAIKPSLKEHGFSITHRVKVEDRLIHVTGILSHKSGHREETTLALPADDSGKKNAVQAVGSSTEYGRRYTMNSLLGIATKDADNDGGMPSQGPATITESQVREIMGLLQKAKMTPEQFCKNGRINAVHELQVDRYQAGINTLKAKIQKLEAGK